MPAFIVVQLHVDDPEAMSRYRAAAAATVHAFGGRYVVLGGRRERLEGAGDCPAVAVVEFPSRERLLAWYRSAEYAPLLAIRRAAARSDVVLIDQG